jgi:hypothetical protein
MRHEPSGICPSLQQSADRRCPSCGAVKPLDDFPADVGTPASCCVPCRHRSAAVAYRHRQRTLRQVARCSEVGYRVLLAELRGGRGDGA